MASALPPAVAGPVAVAALMASGKIDAIPAAAAAVVRRGATPRALREAAYVAALFCGFPAGVAALGALAGLGGGAARRTAPATRAAARARGERTFRRIHRANAGRQLRMLEALHPDFADTVLAEAYGRVLSRPVLPLAVRELVGVAVLGVLGLERQLRAHRMGAENAGAAPAEIRAVLALAARLAGRSPAVRARS